MLIAFQFAAAMACELADDRIGDPLQEQDAGGHVAQVVDAQALDAGPVAGGLEWFPHVPLVQPRPLETDVRLIRREDVLAASEAGEALERGDGFGGQGQLLGASVL
ncbi:MAG: hypothetical protein ABSH46_03275 [Bryobacteraceae bacterium]